LDVAGDMGTPTYQPPDRDREVGTSIGSTASPRPGRQPWTTVGLRQRHRRIKSMLETEENI
jgi:hypothetical protein